MSGASQATIDKKTLRVSLSGFDLINSPRLNKGTAFSDHERDIFDLHGLLPPHVGNLDEQVARRMEALRAQPSAFSKYSFLRALQDANETLFYAMQESRRRGKGEWKLKRAELLQENCRIGCGSDFTPLKIRCADGSIPP